MIRLWGIPRALAGMLARPSYPVPMVFALTVGAATGMVTEIAISHLPAGNARMGLAAALLGPDLVLVAVAALIATGLVHRTTAAGRQFRDVVTHLVKERFNVSPTPTVCPEYQGPLSDIWALGRSLTVRERELASAARDWERRYIEARDLIDLIAEINHALGLHGVLEAVAKGLSRFFAGDAVAIWVYQPQGGLLLAVEVGGGFPRVLSGHEAWVRAVAGPNGQPVPCLLEGAVAAITAPVQDARGGLIGIVAMNSFKRTGYTPAEDAFFRTVIAQAPLAIQNGIAYDQRDALSRLDSLTGLQNRREFDRLIAVEAERAHRYQQPLSLLMIDIDHFKQINDARGHPAGDWALQQVGQLIQQMRIRASDCAFRLGGEEFAILLTQTEKLGALAVAERLRQLVVLHQLFADGTGVTVSVGVASFPGDVAEPSQLLVRADRALYEAKQTGRNRVVAAA